MTGSSVGAGYARGLFELAIARGANRQTLLDLSRLNAEALRDQDGRVPLTQYVRLMRAAKTLSGDPALALHYGEAVDISEVSIVGLVGLASATMTEALAQLNRYVRLIVETENEDGGDRFAIRVERGGAWLVDTRTNPNAFPELTESAFAQLICAPRRIESAPFVKAVHVTHPDPGYGAECERIFAAPVRFGCDRNALQLDESLAAQRVARLPRYVFGVLSERAEALLKELDAGQSVRGSVERLLMPILHGGGANIEAIASRMGVSRQTLFRRLKAEGVTFAQVLDELRHTLALHYLSGRKVSVNETAYLVGFSEPAAFSRAFRRWTGSTPRAARALARAAETDTPPQP